ncbi:hypothetical protein K9M42_01255 [Patescibacteria group bacterium]|nr:hypothetical protein [Patescibacteria group bacterium]
MKLIISLFNALQEGVFYLSNIIMKGYSFIMNITSTGVNEPGIVDVWMMLRDICNMFFILILLIIGISTILGIKKYSYRKNLINVLISAFLINYSKVIVGMMIDFAQIFIIPFNDAISNSISLITHPAFVIDAGVSSVWAAILGFIFSLAFFAVAIIALVYSLIRLVFIWITIAISPIIVLGYGVPFDKVKKSLKGFFQKFISFLMGGILLSFFMWFALYILSSSSSGMVENIKNDTYFYVHSANSETEEVNISGSNMMLMIVSLVFLIYAQKFAISSSKQAGNFAGDIASKANSIGMKPLNKLKGLGLKSAKLGKSTLKGAAKGAANIPKNYVSSASSNVFKTGLSSLRNKSNFFDRKMSNREERLKMGNEAFRQQRTDNYMYGGTPSSKGSIKKETLESLKRNKSMDLAKLKSEGASVSEIKLAKFNWDLKTKEKEMHNSRNKLKSASSPDEKDKIQKELNTKRAEFSKLKGDKAKYINELKDIQFGKSASSEDSSQLKDIKGIMDNIGTGENINLSTEYSDLLGKDGKLKKNITSDSRKEIMATIISKMKNKNLKGKDEEFIENNSALFRTMNQDVLSTMNSQIDKNYSDDERVKKFKQKIKNPGTFELSDKENADIEKGDKYKEYQDLINEAFSEVKNIKTEEERDEKLGELDKKGVKEDFKELFKKQADLIISRKDLEERRKIISRKREELDAIVDTSYYSKEKYEKDIKEISDLEKEYKKEEKDYKKLKKQISSKKIEDLDLGFINKKETNEDASSDDWDNKGFEDNYEGFGESNSSSQSQDQGKSEDASSDDWDNKGFGDGGFGESNFSNQSQNGSSKNQSGSSSNQSQSESNAGFKSESTTNQSQNKENSGKSESGDSNSQGNNGGQSFNNQSKNQEKSGSNKKSQFQNSEAFKNNRTSNFSKKRSSGRKANSSMKNDSNLKYAQKKKKAKESDKDNSFNDNNINNFEDNLEKEKVENKGKTYKETKNKRRRKARKSSGTKNFSKNQETSEKTEQSDSSGNSKNNRENKGF